jgi:hypothetical protein
MEIGLALTPQNNEAFIREVDDEVRRDRVEKAARRYGVIVGVVVVLALIALGGTLWWRSHREQLAGVRGEQLTAAMSDLGSGRDAQATKTLQMLVDAGDKGYAPLARMLLADMAVKSNKPDDASKAFLALANDKSAPEDLRNIALLRATSLDFDRIAPEEVVNRLKPLAVAGTPWFGSAGEMTGIAYLKMNQPKQAGPIFAAIAKDKTVPSSIRSRVAQLAGDYGIDAAPADAAVQPAVSQ